MEPLRLNTSDECHVCKKSKARWSLYVDINYARTAVRHEILFCPVCDQITPEDLEVSDMRTVKLPTPTSQVTGATPPYQLTFRGASEYRTSMGPDRPFRPAGGKTMRRRYNSAGMEVTEG